MDSYIEILEGLLALLNEVRLKGVITRQMAIEEAIRNTQTLIDWLREVVEND